MSQGTAVRAPSAAGVTWTSTLGPGSARTTAVPSIAVARARSCVGRPGPAPRRYVWAVVKFVAVRVVHGLDPRRGRGRPLVREATLGGEPVEATLSQFVIPPCSPRRMLWHR